MIFQGIECGPGLIFWEMSSQRLEGGETGGPGTKRRGGGAARPPRARGLRAGVPLLRDWTESREKPGK